MIKIITLFAAMFFALVCHSPLSAQSITENFDNIGTLTGNGWFLINVSSPAGTTNWFQGSTEEDGYFDAQNGADNSYIAADVNNTAGNGTINNWLVSPNRVFKNGDVITFYTRKKSPDLRVDELQIRLSSNGASTNVGNSGINTGDFTTLLLNVNSPLTTGVYPTTWTMYTITISGLPAPTSGRIGFRYYLTDAGPAGTNGEYIGIDGFQYTPYVCPTITVLPASALPGGTAGTLYSYSLDQTGALGTPSYAIIAGALPPGLTLSASGTISGTPTATGTFNFTAMVADASGCSGSRAYSITVVCPANPVSFDPFSVCSNDAQIDLSDRASPGGGTYGGTGVASYYFDPAEGTQNITYDYTDPYGCSHAKTVTVTVNTVPVVTLADFDNVCMSAVEVTLTGGSPAGGTYSGDNVSGGLFTPAESGITSITYSYTDANGCSASATADIVVNSLPVVALADFDDVCMSTAEVTLTGGSPAGGTYSGDNVSGGLFTPAESGATSIIYSYTDANGCSASATADIVVNSLPVVTLTAFDNVCMNSGNVTLTGGSPSGGTYGGTHVSGGIFSPINEGTTNITYSYTDANGCEAISSSEITVSICANVYEGTNSIGFKCFPNPGTGVITLEFNQKNQSDILIQILDLNGHLVSKEEQKSYKGIYTKTFDLTELSHGIYTMKLQVGDKLEYHKIILQ